MSRKISLSILLREERWQRQEVTGGRELFDDKREVPDSQIVTFDLGEFPITIEAISTGEYMSKTSAVQRPMKTIGEIISIASAQGSCLMLI